MAKILHFLNHAAFGDCSRRICGHSFAYHIPLMGCIKCDCTEYK